MTRQHFLIITLALLLTLSLATLRGVVSENKRLDDNRLSLVEDNRLLRSEVAAERLSVARLRMTVGELEELRKEDAERVREMGIRLRHAQSLTLLSTVQKLDTLVTHIAPHTPMLSDSLCRLRWRDSWVDLAVEVRPTESHITLSSCDTLFQVVRRVPYRWWIFSWGTKAIRQEIRSSNPHTHLVYAEYIEIER